MKHRGRALRRRYGRAVTWRSQSPATNGWFIVDVRDKLAQRVTENAPDVPPRFIKVYAASAQDAISHVLDLKARGLLRAR